MNLLHLTPLFTILTTTAALPIHPRALGLLDLPNLDAPTLTVDWSKANILNTLKSFTKDMPVNIDVWALDQSKGLVGLDVKLDMGELVKAGLVSGAKNQGAKMEVNVTLSGLDSN